MSQYRVTILFTQLVAYNIKQFIVEKPRGYKFIPGQATEVSVIKPGWEDKKRPFTYTSLNKDRVLQFTIKSYPISKFPGHTGVTEQIHKLSAGDKFLIGDPWGTINYKGKGVFIAGGAGITPFIAIFRQLAGEKRLVGNRLIFSNKSAKDIVFQHEFEAIFPKKDLIFTLTQEKRAGFESGRVNKDFLLKHIDNFSQNFYICGPKPMVESLKKDLSSLGAKTDSIVFEE